MSKAGSVCLHMRRVQLTSERKKDAQSEKKGRVWVEHVRASGVTTARPQRSSVVRQRADQGRNDGYHGCVCGQMLFDLYD